MSQRALPVPSGSPQSPPWTKQDGESDVAFAAFVLYRDLPPPRSAPRVAQMLGKNEDLIKRWRKRHDWVGRAGAYTDHLDRLALAETEEDIVQRRREVNAQISETAAALHYAAMARLYGSDDEKRPVAKINLDELDADDVIRWFESAAKWSRISIGLPSDMTGALTITLQDLQVIMRHFFSVAERRMIRADFEALVRECRAFALERLGG